MITRTRVGRLAVITAVAVCPLGLAACGGSQTGTDASTAPSAAASSPMTQSFSPSAPISSPRSASTSSSSMDAPFGPDCSSMPRTGKGSAKGMSEDPVATAASNNSGLSTLVTAVETAGLVDTLNTTEDLTVFAPANGAFKAMDQVTLKNALGDPKGLLTDVLTAHVVAGRLSPDELTGGHKTLNRDQKITVTGSGERFTVNGTAKIVCGNVQTANATVYIIDGVLLPKS